MRAGGGASVRLFLRTIRWCSGVISSPIVVNLDTINNDFTFTGGDYSRTPLSFQSVKIIGESGAGNENSAEAISPLSGNTRIEAVLKVRT